MTNQERYVSAAREALAWQDDALCAQIDPELFIASDEEKNGAKAALAKRVCAACLVTDECLEYALANNEEGVWGALSDNQRKKLKKSRETPKPSK